ncbi:hypothetical protein GJ496_011911 [Pomphorhynchus laevis]|nr:hypothetical protein GJ496_011911 [Pomphorhynchus laevis]
MKLNYVDEHLLVIDCMRNHTYGQTEIYEMQIRKLIQNKLGVQENNFGFTPHAKLFWSKLKAATPNIVAACESLCPVKFRDARVYTKPYQDLANIIGAVFTAQNIRLCYYLALVPDFRLLIYVINNLNRLDEEVIQNEIVRRMAIVLPTLPIEGRRNDDYRNVRNAEYIRLDYYKDQFKSPQTLPAYNPRGHSAFRRMITDRTKKNVAASRESKTNTESISKSLDVTKPDYDILKFESSTHSTLKYLPGSPNLLPFIMKTGEQENPVTSSAAAPLESLTISAYIQSTPQTLNAAASGSVFVAIAALRPVNLGDFTITKTALQVVPATLVANNQLRLERYLTMVNDALMIGIIMACIDVSTDEQLTAAILARSRLFVPAMPAAVNDVNYGNVRQLFDIPQPITKDKQSIIQVMMPLVVIDMILGE